MQRSALTDRALSLRTADHLGPTVEELEARRQAKLKLERKIKKAARQKAAKERSDQETELLLTKVPLENSDLEVLGGESVDSESRDNEEVDSETDNDSDWEEIDEDEKTPEYNTLKLKNFSRECDRYKVPNRAAAKLANALMKDLKIVTKNETSKLICPGKLRRERLRWGGELEKSHSANPPPGGIYSDGKKCPTLVRDTTSIEVQVQKNRHERQQL